jgi:peroxiredoxin
VRAIAVAAALMIVSSAALAALKPGDPAPSFTLQAAQGGKEFSFSLQQALAKGPVVLYFYPKSFTSVCTIEAHEFAEAIEQFAAMGASVIGVSSDKIATQRDFSSKECRDKFPVGADPHFNVIRPMTRPSMFRSWARCSPTASHMSSLPRERFCRSSRIPARRSTFRMRSPS